MEKIENWNAGFQFLIFRLQGLGYEAVEDGSNRRSNDIASVARRKLLMLHMSEIEREVHRYATA